MVEGERQQTGKSSRWPSQAPRHCLWDFDMVKRCIDVVASAVGLALTAPLQLVIATVLLVTQGRPVFFRQPRPGRDAVIFELVKFRTMRVPDEKRVTSAERITRVGALLRSTSMDELPTLWNVLKGDMSLVGPRPLLVRYLPLYSPEQSRRHEVRPGITGLAQVSGRNLLPWHEKFRLDVDYVDNRRLSLDMKIMLLTIQKVLVREGISPGNAVTPAPFLGNEDQR